MTASLRPAVLFLAGFAGLLAAFPVRVPELWRHLVNGRALTQGGRPTGSWLFDLMLYLSDGLSGGWGVAALRVAAAAGMGTVLVRAVDGGRLATAAITLGVLACGPRLLSLNTLLLLLFALLIERIRAGAPRWQLILVVLVWANVDRWVWLGVGATALMYLGRAFDGRGATVADLRRAAATVLLLAVAAVLNPAVLTGREGVFALGSATGLAMRSPFTPEFREAVAASPAALAYFPLLLLSAASFLLTGWRWERFLPWLVLAAASGYQARFVPMFAVMAGLVMAWNLNDWATRRAVRPRPAFSGLTAFAAAGLLVAAWPGWLIGPPYEPRRLAVDLPAAVEQSAAAVAALGRPGRTLHLSTDTLHGFEWFLPSEAGQLADPEGEAVRQFQAGTGADRAIFLLTGPTPTTPALHLLAGSDPRTLVHFGGGGAVFANAPVAQPFDLDRLGLGATTPPTTPSPPHWTTPFLSRRSAWSANRGEAAAAGLIADTAGASAFAQHAAVWEVIQTAGLVGTTGMADLGVRLTLLAPPGVMTGQPPPSLTAQVLGLVRQFAVRRDDVPIGVAYAAVRSARRATIDDPTSAAAYHLLGEAYLRLVNRTQERVWGAMVPQLLEIRRAQAAAALERAIRLSPRRRDTHIQLAQLYREIGYIDLVVEHLRAANEPADEAIKELALRQTALARDAVGARVLDKAQTAAQLGLGGEALRLLLGTDVAAFGIAGVELELTLLNRTGGAADVLAWTTPEYKQTLGPATYHRLRSAAAAALGDYTLADAELAALVGEAVPLSMWAQAVGERALNELAGSGDLLPHLGWRALGESDFMTTVARMVRNEDGRAEVRAVRGLLALEAGDTGSAKTLFTEAADGDRPNTAGERMGQAGLEWIAKGAK